MEFLKRHEFLKNIVLTFGLLLFLVSFASLVHLGYVRTMPGGYNGPTAFHQWAIMCEYPRQSFFTILGVIVSSCFMGLYSGSIKDD